MKRKDLVKHLRSHGCEIDAARSGRGSHEVWINPTDGETAPVPRHREIKTMVGRQICRQLGVPVIKLK